MNKAFWGFFFLTALAFASFFAGKKYHERQLASLQERYVQVDHGFRPTSFPLTQHPFVLFIYGFNNAAFVEKTIRSVNSLVYDNYRVIYVDDASTDGSYEVALDKIYEYGQMGRTTCVRNDQHLGYVANLSRAVQSCEDHELIVLIDGQDWLAHEWVLSRLNQYYADADLWMTHGQSCEFPSFQKARTHSFPSEEFGRFRSISYSAGPLQTFYAGLFKNIDEADLISAGGSSELSYLLPLVELAGEHVQGIPETLYIINTRAPSRINLDLASQCELRLRALKAYSPLVALDREGQGL